MITNLTVSDNQSDVSVPSDSEPQARIKSLMVNDGTEAQLPAIGVTCVVGANNVGKSQFLRDIRAYLSEEQTVPVVLKQLELDCWPPEITDDQAKNWLNRGDVASLTDASPGREPTYTPLLGGNAVSIGSFTAWWNQQPRYFKPLGSFFVWHASAGSLSGYASQTYTPMMGHTSPIARVFADGLMDQRLSDLCEETFGFPLIFDRWTNFNYRVGTVSAEVPPANRPDPAFTRAVATLPSLENQGDGVKSFLGLALVVIASKTGILLLDEPESFLHPGQARAMGRWLADTAAEQDKQVIVATHNRDFVLGVLEANREAAMVRVTRRDSMNTIHELDWQAIQDLWSDPVLRYSNLLQGLFHELVIVCEGDADCRFYGAVLDSLYASGPKRSIVHNALLVPSGGKERMHAMVKAIKGIGGSPRIIADFDFLNDKRRLKAIVEAMKATWDSNMEKNFKEMTSGPNQKELWKTLKKQGIDGLRGDARQAAEKLLGSLASIGIVIVSCGEMEYLDRNLSSDKSAWVSEMLEKGNHETNPRAKELVCLATATLA